MEIVSLIIMLIGLAALIAIYWFSRRARQDMPQQSRNLAPIGTLTDDKGQEMSSILADQAARDGKLPNENAPNMNEVMYGYKPVPIHEVSAEPTPATEQTNDLPPQLIMFIAAEADDFKGVDVLTALENSGLHFGDMNVYHRMILTEKGEESLFYVANGVKPWTLVPEEIALEQTPGLSMILNLPSPVSTREAIHDFVKTAERLKDQLGGVIKNQNQDIISDADLRAYYAMI